MHEDGKMITGLKSTDDGVLFYQVVLGDGTLHRFSLIPGSDTSGHPEEVVSLAQATWTPEVVSAYREQLVSQCLLTGATA
jgi:hypothetical protein